MVESKPGSVAVIILNYNQWKMTAQCIDSVLESDYSNFTIFLTDNGSKPEEIEQLKKLFEGKIELQRIEPNRGYVGGMNFGLEWSSEKEFDYYLVMNNDAIIASDAITEFLNCAKRYSNKCIVTGKVYHFDQPDVIQHIGYRYVDKKYLKTERMVVDKVDEGQWDEEMEMDMIDDIFWLIPAEVYQTIGGYSDNFWFNAEQADLALRAVEAGNKLIYTPKAKLWHKGSLSIGGRSGNPRLTFYNSQARLTLHYLHLPKYRFFVSYFSTLFNIIVKAIKSSIKLIFMGKKDFTSNYANFLALVYFTKWMFHQKPNSGKNPFD